MECWVEMGSSGNTSRESGDKWVLDEMRGPKILPLNEIIQTRKIGALMYNPLTVFQ